MANQPLDHEYFPAIWTAGYSGFVIYKPHPHSVFSISSASPSYSVWLIPGTWDFDWDNR